jgi:hypothetical protein
MAKQTIDIGTSANKGDGDPLRVAFDKINDNFDELYARDTGADPEAFTSNLIPSTDNTYNLGSEAKQWSDAYIQDFLYLGGVRLSTDSNGNLIIGGTIQQKVDVVASVFADDSTLLVDGVNGLIVGDVDNDNVTTYFVNFANTGCQVFVDEGGYFYLRATNTDSDIIIRTNASGAGEYDFVFGKDGNLTVEGSVISNVTGDLTGSVFADDSTLLVDGVNGIIPGYVSIQSLQTIAAASNDFDEFKAAIAAL